MRATSPSARSWSFQVDGARECVALRWPQAADRVSEQADGGGRGVVAPVRCVQADACQVKGWWRSRSLDRQMPVHSHRDQRLGKTVNVGVLLDQRPVESGYLVVLAKALLLPRWVRLTSSPISSIGVPIASRGTRRHRNREHPYDRDRQFRAAPTDRTDTPYYVVPNEPVAQEAFAIIREAMRHKSMVALGRLVLALRPAMATPIPRTQDVFVSDPAVNRRFPATIILAMAKLGAGRGLVGGDGRQAR